MTPTQSPLKTSLSDSYIWNPASCYSHVTQLKYSRFSHDVTKIQTKRLSILLTVYFHEVLQQLNNLLYTIFRFAIEDA